LNLLLNKVSYKGHTCEHWLSLNLFLHLQLGHVPPEPVVPHTIRFLFQSFFQHSSQTMIRPKSLWSAERKVKSSAFLPQSLHSLILHSSLDHDVLLLKRAYA
jgi:hypothetical protein